MKQISPTEGLRRASSSVIVPTQKQRYFNIEKFNFMQLPALENLKSQIIFYYGCEHVFYLSIYL